MKSKVEFYRKSIECHLKKGLSTREIAKLLNLSQSLIQRVRNSSKSTLEIKKGGRPSKLTPVEKRRILHYVCTGQAKTTSEASDLLKQDTGKTVSRWTVKRAMNNQNYSAEIKKKKPLLSDRNIAKRKQFVKAYNTWSNDDWKKVIWSDESKINRYQTDGIEWTWKKQGTPKEPKDYIQTIKHGGGNIKIWGCFSAHGVGPIHKIDGNMNKEMYLNILKTHLTETVDFMPYSNKEVVFQQDNDPKHTAKIVKSWINDQEFSVLDWCAQSPDLNPIENLWSYLKQALKRNYDSPAPNLKVLWERVQFTWYNIPNEYCERLVASMPRRLTAVAKAKGRWTKY